MLVIDKAIDQGAIADMRTASPALAAMRATTSPALPVHAVVGNVTPNGVPLPNLNPLCVLGLNTPVCVALQFTGYSLTLPQILQSDTIVSINSAGGGLPTADQSTFPVPHFTIPSVAAGETSNSIIATELIRLLNEQASATDSDYAPHF
jgi:hypothetical protein